MGGGAKLDPSVTWVITQKINYNWHMLKVWWCTCTGSFSSKVITKWWYLMQLGLRKIDHNYKNFIYRYVSSSFCVRQLKNILPMELVLHDYYSYSLKNKSWKYIEIERGVL